ncbi:MAG: DUF4091 domain-containing protein [Clostridiales bacterium]|nr:DUF4091 domain-containing protein [Clostridiales bacterium]
MSTKKFLLYGVDGNTTVLLDKAFPQRLKKLPEIFVQPVINGHDSYQIILQAKEEIDNYLVEIRDLVNKNGEVLSKEYIKVYNCKYTLVTTNVEYFYGFGTGYYPNAILPMETAVKFKENNVKKGNSQSIYFSFYVPENISSGYYQGNFVLKIDGEEVLIPVIVDVPNVILPKENHLRSLFLSDWDWKSSSSKSDFSIYNSYTETLTDYRLSPYHLIPYPEEKDLEYLYEFHAEFAYNYCLNPVNTTFAVPYRNWERESLTPGSKGLQSDKDRGLEREVFENFLVSLINKSLQKKFNIMKRAVAHFGRFIDEPNGQKTMDRLISTYEIYHEILNKLADEIKDNAEKYQEKYSVDEIFLTDLESSVRNMPHIITAHYDQKYDAYIDDYCPCFWEYQKLESFELYKKDKELWWYGCNGPTSPCPTYHLDDSLLSPRILSWLQYKYGYVGNLFWAVNYYKNKPKEKKDFYEHYDTIQREGNVNGDGLLIYPGEIYDLKKNVPTLRMEAIRAGMEDYEVLYALGEKYRLIKERTGLNVDIQSMIEAYVNCLTYDIKIIGDNYAFNQIRKMYLNLSELNTETGFCIYGIKIENGKIRGRILLDCQYKIFINNQVLLPFEVKDGLHMYEFCVESNDAFIKISSIDYEKVLNMSLPIQIETYNADNSFVKISNVNVDVKTILCKNENNEKALQFIIPTEKALVQVVKFEMEQFKDFDEKMVAMVLNFENKKPGHKFEGFDIQAKFEKEDYLRTMVSEATYLPPDQSHMPIYLSRNDWSKSGRLEYLMISFGKDIEEYEELRKEIPIKEYVYLQSIEILKNN